MEELNPVQPKYRLTKWWFGESRMSRDGGGYRTGYMYRNGAMERTFDFVAKVACWVFETPYVRVIPICLTFLMGMLFFIFIFLPLILIFTLFFGVPKEV